LKPESYFFAAPKAMALGKLVQSFSSFRRQLAHH
jgi:hypothetical protein